MGGLLNRVVGGALAGFGEAAINEAKQRREDAIAALAEQNRRTDAATEHGYTLDSQNNQSANADVNAAAESSRELSNKKTMLPLETAAHIQETRASAGATAGAEGGLLSTTIQDDQGNTYGITRSGKKIDLGVKDDKSAAKDDQILNRINDVYSVTTIDPDSQKPIKSVDKAGAAQALTQMGRPDLAKIYTAGGPASKPPVPKSLSSIPGLQYSASKKQFRDPATNTTYDANGNKVQ